MPGNDESVAVGAAVEVLVYNVSHADLVISLAHEGTNTQIDGEHESYGILARPKFSIFQPLSLKLLDVLEENAESVETVFVSEFNDDFDTSIDSQQSSVGGGGGTGRGATGAARAAARARGPERQVGAGLKLPDGSTIAWPSWGDLHMHTSAAQTMLDSQKDSVANSTRTPEIDTIYFPLLAQLLPRWFELSGAHEGEPSEKQVFLVTGAGRPRNKNHSIQGNSTSGLAQLMRLFMKLHFPFVNVVLLDSVSGVFHYDENVTFVRSRLLPELERLRNDLTLRHRDSWKDFLGVTIALTDGTPARLAAINASLRKYRPTYLHMWQLKTFWHEQRMIASDLQSQTFENIETNPCVRVEKLDTNVQLLVKEMIKHKDQFETVRRGGTHEMSAFWLRKTRKPVLSVLMIQREGDAEPSFFRGMNVEVSMPTGSLCSERNVIGTALASDQSLCRSDFKMIAVLSMTLDQPHIPAVHRIASTSTVTQISRRPLHKFGSFDVSEELTVGDASFSATNDVTCASEGVPRPPLLGLDASNSSSQAAQEVEHHLPSPLPMTPPSLPSSPRPLRKRTLSTGSHSGGSNLNPISPCGACEEWLKKIAEVNPTFKVITFPDSECSSAFVNEIF